MHLKLDMCKLLFLLTSLLLASVTGGLSAEKRSLTERLGYKPTDKILIINGDDTGMCHAANLATIESLEKGLMRSATIMVKPSAGFPEIAAHAKQNPRRTFSIHLCHTSEWGSVGPVTDREKVPGLLDADGYLCAARTCINMPNRRSAGRGSGATNALWLPALMSPTSIPTWARCNSIRIT